jgi:hypothetical protein
MHGTRDTNSGEFEEGFVSSNRANSATGHDFTDAVRQGATRR